jgi:Holliday junction resolvase
VSDILGIYRGLPLAIEVKSDTGRLTKEQAEFLQDFAAEGGIAFVARSADEVRSRLKELAG